jgi:hypothetical protein
MYAGAGQNRRTDDKIAGYITVNSLGYYDIENTNGWVLTDVKIHIGCDPPTTGGKKPNFTVAAGKFTKSSVTGAGCHPIYIIHATADKTCE